MAMSSEMKKEIRPKMFVMVKGAVKLTLITSDMICQKSRMISKARSGREKPISTSDALATADRPAASMACSRGISCALLSTPSPIGSMMSSNGGSDCAALTISDKSTSRRKLDCAAVLPTPMMAPRCAAASGDTSVNADIAADAAEAAASATPAADCTTCCWKMTCSWCGCRFGMTPSLAAAACSGSICAFSCKNAACSAVMGDPACGGTPNTCAAISGERYDLQ
mmetsp:Transcript_38389/g.118613  ORF Transcript_38389/g.118613 Transcript_38389/m.118613 type:complete len:225 (-) Transcript_38389:18-692(-)